MTMIDALQIDCVELTGPTSGQGLMHLTSYHAQPQGYLNGGATLAFGEILSGMLSNQLIRDDQFAVGQSVTANHMRPMKAEGDLIAKGQLLLQGKTSHVWRFDMYDESNRLISQVTVTCAIVPKNR